MTRPVVSAKQGQDDPAYTRVGVRGVRLKKFEEAVADLLPHVRPHFVRLPTRCTVLQSIPTPLVNGGVSTGQLSGVRAMRKEGQLRSLLQCVMAMILKSPEDSHRPITIVDFCGGTGHLAIPLALLLPQCHVVVVDLKATSLKLLHEKALSYSPQGQDNTNNQDSLEFLLDDTNLFYKKGSNVTCHEQIKRACRGIPNLYTFHGSIETFRDDFDIGVALHACGEASDVVLRACARVHANFCIAPCCVGKLHSQRHNPYVFHATADNVPTITYPQSKLVKGHVNASQWDDLIKAADYSNVQELRSPRNATRRTAKALLETDRLLYMQEMYGYRTALTRMDPWESSPKNDILLGWKPTATNVGSPYHDTRLESDEDCNADIELSMQHLLSTELLECHQEISTTNGVDWTLQEEQEVWFVLNAFRQGNERQYNFPSGAGSRTRKLIHCMADQMGLMHWGSGKKDSEKTVIVAKRCQ